MNVLRDINWFAIQTKPSRENAARMNIQRLGLEVLLPQIKTQKIVWGLPQDSIKPLFPSYLFARFCPANHLHSIQYARGVRQVVWGGSLPLPIDEEIIQVIKLEVGENGFVDLQPRTLRPGDRVVIKEGPLQGLKGLFKQEFSDKQRVMVLLETIEYQAQVLIERGNLQYAAERI